MQRASPDQRPLRWRLDDPIFPQEYIDTVEWLSGSVKGNAARVEMANAFDTTRTWVDPNGYRLSDRLWKASARDRAAIDRILQRAVLDGEGIREVTQQLERYLTDGGRYGGPGTSRDGMTRTPPVNRRSWLEKLTGRERPQFRVPFIRRPERPIGLGNYAARRLARTELSRAYNEAYRQSVARNPFAKGVRWNLSPSHPLIDICDEYAGADLYNLGSGVYPVNETPRMPAHPNCLCRWTTVTIDSGKDLETLVNDIRAAYNLGGPVELGPRGGWRMKRG
jgi:hypothetical protein